MRKRKFGREKNVRAGLLKSLAEEMILRGKIRTTEARAKTLRPLVERLLTRARTPTLANRRLLAKRLGPETNRRLFTEWGPRYRERSGGYSRITKLPARSRDGAKMAIIEFV